MSEKDNSVPSLSFEIKRRARIKRTVRHLARVGGMAPQSRLAKHPGDASPSR
jgi:hypothetical protein